jgi:hypothetical protein
MFMFRNALLLAVLALGGLAAVSNCSSNSPCPPGAHRCACTATGSCNSQLICMDNICFDMTATKNMGGNMGLGMGGMGGGPFNNGSGGSNTNNNTGGIIAGGTGGSGPTGTGGAPMCSSPTTANACTKCLAGMCCKELVTCRLSPSPVAAANDPMGRECNALLSCLQNCAVGDKPCEDNCLNQHPTGTQPLVDLLDCLDGKCNAPCDNSTTDGGTTDGGGPVADGGAPTCGGPNRNACGMCVDQKCCAEYSACNASPACVTYATCLNNCAVGDTKCEQACATATPAGVPIYNKLDLCGTGNCSQACM